MHKMWLVAQREFIMNITRRSFLFAAFGVPLLLVAIILVVFLVISANESTLEDAGIVGYVDYAGVLALAEDKPETFMAFASEEEAAKALEDKTLGAYFVVPQDYMRTGQVQVYNLGTTSDALRKGISGFLLANLTAQIRGDIPLERVKNPTNTTVYVQETGRFLEGGAGVFLSLFLPPILFSMVFMMASQVSSGFLMNGVVEEKTNRIMEILITSITPLQMLAGKILGLGALGLVQFFIWGAATAVIMAFSEQIPFLKDVIIPANMLVVGFIYFLLGYFLLASIMAGLAAVAGTEEESRQYAGIFSLVLVIPFFAIGSLIQDPNGTVAVVLTMVPFTAPLTVILRMSFGVVPPEQIMISITVLLVSTVFVTWASAKVFRWGLLLYGKKLSLRELWRAIRSSSDTDRATVAAHSVEGEG